MTLTVNEVFTSIQGESSFAGRPCLFIRLTGCNLRCTYCDTRYAYNEGREVEIEELAAMAATSGCRLVEITGGEPLLQPQTPELVRRLLAEDCQVLMETNGSLDIRLTDPACIKIMDIKCPSSGHADQNDMENLHRLSNQDEVKFVIGDRTDFDFACDIVRNYLQPDAFDPGRILFSTVYRQLAPRQLVEWMLAGKVRARFQLQLHKYIWAPHQKGV